MGKTSMVIAVAILVLAASGCRDDENKRLAEMAERNLERQAQQERRNTELQRQVADGTRRLVEADADARQNITEMQRNVQAERQILGEQRDRLEDERRQIAAARNRDPIIAESIKAIGLLIACSVPLLITLQILRRGDTPDESAVVAELLLSDMVADHPTIVRLVDATPEKSSADAVDRLTDRRDSDSHP
ncbi:hypothetical protein [Rhodopirellula sp. SWK7]|uniref:hypothetical protein n=1 Tax=Rhodopirellula sp. SWK7 TaxID=595460 RepID=UPI0002BE31BC|nr:hypothetical protein [Rhodopirellula sp. SWK7]EMI44894.1 putative secreted protein [Rhodopirellula sp. SWK7]